MQIDKAGRDDQARGVENFGIGWRERSGPMHAMRSPSSKISCAASVPLADRECGRPLIGSMRWVFLCGFGRFGGGAADQVGKAEPCEWRGRW